jgi:hypothetical protein
MQIRFKSSIPINIGKAELVDGKLQVIKQQWTPSVETAYALGNLEQINETTFNLFFEDGSTAYMIDQSSFYILPQKIDAAPPQGCGECGKRR